jgi:signal transduction histidine kinase
MLNLAGFGAAAWDTASYTPKQPFTYRNTQIPLYDRNLQALSRKVRANALVAHLRGVAPDSNAQINEQNLHPFMFEGVELALAHNGDLASFQQMRQFSADVSHELRTPITAIRGQLEVALFTAETTDQYREAMFNALTDIDRLSQIVRALLMLSQAESGQIILQKSRLNLCEVVDDLVEQFQIPAEAAGVRLTAELPQECSAEVDRVQIERMITNLLSNALKFTPEGGQVTMSLQVLPTFVEMVVEDNGRGIPTEHLPHIFDRFYRVAGDGAAPGPEQGLGLGLSFVAWIVKAHNAKIEVDSVLGRGTRFTIKLPNESVESLRPTGDLVADV